MAHWIGRYEWTATNREIDNAAAKKLDLEAWFPV